MFYAAFIYVCDEICDACEYVYDRLLAPQLTHQERLVLQEQVFQEAWPVLMVYQPFQKQRAFQEKQLHLSLGFQWGRVFPMKKDSTKHRHAYHDVCASFYVSGESFTLRIEFNDDRQ